MKDIKLFQDKIIKNDFSFNTKSYLSLINQNNLNDNKQYLDRLINHYQTLINDQTKKVNQIIDRGFDFNQYLMNIDILKQIQTIYSNKSKIINEKVVIKQRISFLRKKLRQW